MPNFYRSNGCKFDLPGLVSGILALPTILVHGDEIKSSIESASSSTRVDIECKLLVQHREHLIVVIILHQIQPRANVRPVSILGQEVDLDRFPAGGDAIGTCIIGTIDGTFRSTSLVVAADSSVPRVSGVAICRSRSTFMGPSPVGVQHDFAIDVRATSGGTSLPCDRRVYFGLVCAG